MGCTIAKRHGYFEGLDRADIYAYCDGELKRVEAKETLAWHKEGERVRPGRFVLSDTPFEIDCYAFGVDDQIDGTLTIDFVLPDDAENYIRRAKLRPKYPITRLKEIREGARCFPDQGTIMMDRERLLEMLR